MKYFTLITALISASMVFASGELKTKGVIANGSVAVGDSSASVASAILDVKSIVKGALLPRMTTAQMNAISSPATGLLVWNTTNSKLYEYTGSVWQSVGVGPLTTKGDLFTFSSANARLAVGADGTVLTADSAQTTGLKWSAVMTNPMSGNGDMIYGGSAGAATRLPALASGATLVMGVVGGVSVPTWSQTAGVTPNVISVSSNNTAATTVGVIYADASGGSFTQTIPVAASMPGQTLYIQKTDSQPKVVSMAGGFTRHLYTPGETYLLQSSNSAWQVLEHKTAYTFNPEVISVSAVTTNPNKGTILRDNQTCQRVGSRMNCIIQYVHTAAGTAGSGMYYLNMPQAVSGVGTIDTAKTGTYTAGFAVDKLAPYGVGSCILNNAGGSPDYHTFLVPFDATRFVVVSPANNDKWGSGVQGFNNTAIYFGCNYSVPIAEWAD